MKAKTKINRLFSLLMCIVMVLGLMPPKAAYAETTPTYITKIEINDFNPEFYDGMTGNDARYSLTFSYPDDANYSKGNNNIYIEQNGTTLYDDKLTAGEATLMIEVYANPFGNEVENPAYDFDGENLGNIEVWINGEKREDVEVKYYNKYWRCVDLYIPVTVSEYTGVKHTVTYDSNGGSAVPSEQVMDNGYASEPEKPTNGDKVFTGWYTDAELTTKFKFSSTKITSDITLYAGWEDKVIAQNITKIEINDFNPEFYEGMTGNQARYSFTFSYPDDANYSKGNYNIYIEQNGTTLYDDKLTAGEATLMIEVYANPFGNEVENPAYDFDGENLGNIEVWINGEKREDVEVKYYNSAWRSVDIYIPVTVAGARYDITVTGGAASNSSGTAITAASAGTVVTLTADDAPDGQVFDKWVANGVTVADETSATTTFTMPEGAVTAEATYRDARNGLVYDSMDDKWYYYVDDAVDTSKTGLVQGADSVFWYVNAGVVDTSYTGFITNGAGTWYVISGKLDTGFTGLGKDGDKFIAVFKGKAYPEFTGIIQNAGYFWYVKAGSVDTTYTGFYENENGKWYVANGKVDTSFKGLGKDGDKWLVVLGGKHDSTYTGLIKNGGAFWYVKDGVLDTTFTGITETGGASWLVATGKLRDDYTGTYTDGTGTYNIVNGKVTE